MTDEGLASPYGRGARSGRRGRIYPLSHFVTAPPKWEPRGTRETDCDRRESLERATPVCATLRYDCHRQSLLFQIRCAEHHWFAMTRTNCRFSCRGGHWPPAHFRDFIEENGRPMAAPTSVYGSFLHKKSPFRKTGRGILFIRAYAKSQNILRSVSTASDSVTVS